MATFRFPSKTFLLGEYAVLQGTRALLLGHPPYFEASFTPGAAAHPFHPESPAGQWLAQNPIEGSISFRDPHAGKGGFGGSGAEFLSAWVPNQEIPEPQFPHAIFSWSAWEDSRRLHGVGSGADILVQSYGVNRTEAFWLFIDIDRRNLNEIFPPKPPQAELSLFHTGRKLATHEQVKPAQLPVAELDAMVGRAAASLEQGALGGFVAEVKSYGQALAELGLVAPHTSQALAGLHEMPGVLAAKGCGAMGADVIMVVHTNADLGAWAQENSLAPVGNFPV